MSWIKLDDQWMDHPKIIRAGRDARDLWLASITWCAKHLTDGFFPMELLPSLAVSAGIDVANVKQFASTLLDVRLWDASENGYRVHDYLDYNPTKAQTEANRIARSEAGKRGGQVSGSKRASKTEANGQAKSKQKSTPSPSPSPVPNLKENHPTDDSSVKKSSNGYCESAKYLLASIGGRRLNPKQVKSMQEYEDLYGKEKVYAAIDWAAKTGMSIGKAIGSFEKALPKWGQPKPSEKQDDTPATRDAFARYT